MSKGHRQAKSRWGLWVLLSMGAFGVMGGALVAPGLPSLIEPFGIEEGSAGLVLSVYTLSAAAALPVIGLLLDRLGRRRVAIGCLLVDGIFGVLCASAPSFGVLLLFRFIQGIGIAGLIPVAMTVIRDWYADRKLRLKMIGYLTGTISASAVLIPLLGGTLAAVDWRYPFWMYGFSLVLAGLFAVFIPETGPVGQDQIKILDDARQYLGSMVRALSIQRVRETFAHALVLYFLLYAMVTFLPLFLVYGHSLGEVAAGSFLSFQALLSAFVATRAHVIDDLVAPRSKLTLGFGLIVCALISLPLWAAPSGVVISLLIFGSGMGVVQPAIYHEATAAPPEELAGFVVALFNTMKYLGMSLSPVLLGYLARFLTQGQLFGAAAGVAGAWILAFNLRSGARGHA